MSEYLSNFDPDVLLDAGEDSFDFDDLVNMPLIGQEEQDPALDFDLSLLPDATAAAMERVDIRDARLLIPSPSHQTSSENHQFRSDRPITPPIPITNPGEHRYLEAPREPATQLEQSPYTRSCEADPVASGHYPVFGSSKYSCIQCNASFPRQAALNNHASISQHSPFACSCEERFSRLDALNRHCNSFLKVNRSYPCKFCKRHRDRKAFGRRDHFVQHLRGYHKFDQEEIDKICPKNRLKSDYRQVLVCPYAGCEHHRGYGLKIFTWSRSIADIPFKNQSDYKKHLKDVHEDTLFPCHVAGCDRVGRRGYMLEKGLMKHLATQHPADAPEYSLALREKTVYYCCDCGMCCYNATALRYHYCRYPYFKED